MNDYVFSYKSHLTTLHLFPLCLVRIKWHNASNQLLQEPSSSLTFTIIFHSSLQRHHQLQTNLFITDQLVLSTHTQHFYFTRISRLWNILPVIDLILPISTYTTALKNLWNHFTSHFDYNDPCSFHILYPCCRCSFLPKTNLHTNLIN